MECKTVISDDKAVSVPLSQVRDQSEDEGDEILTTAEQVFLPRFASTRLAARRRAAQRRTQAQRRHHKTKRPQRRKYHTYYNQYRRPWYYHQYNYYY
jgi:hypothetical protein